MLRIAHLIETADAPSGGTTTAFFSILDAIATRPGQLKATAYFLRPPDHDPAWERIRRAPDQFRLADSRGRLLRPGALGRAVADDLASGVVDVLHIHGMWCPDLVAAASAARRAGVPVLWQSHGMMLRWAMNYKRWKKRAYLACGLSRELAAASGFVCMTRDELQDSVFPANCPPERRFLVPLPVSLPDAIPDRAAPRAAGRERFGIPPDALIYAFLGRLHPVKRVEMTIEAFAHARGGAETARLLILGKGEADYEAMLRHRAAELGVAHRVIFAGWVGGDAKLQGLAAADALVVNSSIESFGYVLFEAIGVGTPVIITDNISLAAEFHEAGAAIRSANSIESLADSMAQLAARSPEERSAMARRGWAWARESFSLQAVGRLLQETYSAVARPRAAPAAS